MGGGLASIFPVGHDAEMVDESVRVIGRPAGEPDFHHRTGIGEWPSERAAVGRRSTA